MKDYTDFIVTFNRNALPGVSESSALRVLKTGAEVALKDIFDRHHKGQVRPLTNGGGEEPKVLAAGIDGAMAAEIRALPGVKSVTPDFDIGPL